MIINNYIYTLIATSKQKNKKKKRQWSQNKDKKETKQSFGAHSLISVQTRKLLKKKTN